jgi:hypothetical protein
MTNSYHKLAVANVLKTVPGSQERKFKKNLIKSISTDNDFGKDDAEYIKEECQMIPDAYVIDAKNRMVTVFEVESSYTVSPDKLKRLTMLWWALDCVGFGWGLVCKVITKHQEQAIELDLCRAWYDENKSK